MRLPPADSFRGGGQIGQWFASPGGGCRSLQEFKKISIVEVKGYCYGWHFYQAADADLVISVRRRPVRPRLVPLPGLGPAHVDLGADDGPAQVPGDGLHRTSVHRGRDVRLQLPQQGRPARPARGRDREVRAGLLAQPADRHGVPAEALLRAVQAVPGRADGRDADRPVRVARALRPPGPGRDDARRRRARARAHQRGQGQRRAVPARLPAQPVGRGRTDSERPS